MIAINAQCVKCRHVLMEGGASSALRCLAFPDGVPGEILIGDNEHLASYPGDKGIQFKKREGDTT